MNKILQAAIVLALLSGTIYLANLPNSGLTNTGNTNIMALSIGSLPINPQLIPNKPTPSVAGGGGGGGSWGASGTPTDPNLASIGQNFAQGVGASIANQSTPTATTDPAAAAAAAAQAAQDAKINSVISAGTSSALAGGDAGAGTAASQYTAQGEGLYNTTQAGQNTIDQARKSIGLNQINGIKDLMNTIKQGLQGTGVQLGNTNALDSSAAGAAARAYGNYGNVEENKINNSAADANQGQDVNQANLNLARDTGMETLRAFRDSSIKSIQDSAVQALSSLANTVAFLGGDAGKIDVDGIKAQILQNAQNQLGSVDQHISNMLGGVHAASADQTAQDAYSASNAGATPSGPALPFQLDSSALNGNPAQAGADGSMIPLALKSKALA